MTSTALLLLAMALVLWKPVRTASGRLAAMGGVVTRWASGPRTTHVALCATLGISSAVVIGWPTGPLIGVVIAALSWWLLQRLTRPRTPDPDPLALAACWDLLAACLRAGLPVATAISAVAEDLPGDAARALRSTADGLAMGADPVDAWAPALRCPQTAPLARGARHTARAGTALADLVGGLAAGIRESADDHAEARAQRVGVLITAPLGACFLPAFVCLGIAPVIAGLTNQLNL